MIKNKKQYQVTCERLSAFKQAVAALKVNGNADPLLKNIQVNALIAQAEILEEEIREYELTKEKADFAAEAK